MTEPENKKEDQVEENPVEENSSGQKKPLPDVGEVRIDRRNFMGKMIAGCGGVAGIQLGYAGVSFLATKPKGEKKPVRLSLSDLPVGGRQKVMYGGNPAEVIRDEKGVTAVNLVCTHLGCLVIWKQERSGYHCPCHDGWFDAEGKVTAGPPPLPLEKIPVRVEGNTIIVGEE